MTRIFHLLILSTWFLLPGSDLSAGNGPHNWLIVYDPSDADGVAIARHYQEARLIPESNLVAWNFPRRSSTSPSLEATIQASEAWDLVEHLRTTMAERGIFDQIHGIALTGNAPIGVELTVFLNGVDASMTTWLAFSKDATDQIDLEQRVQEDNNAFRNLRMSGAPPIEMRSDKVFEGEWLGSPTVRRYTMSQHLGFTGINGNRVDEVVEMIDRSIAADGLSPRGTVYWPLNPNTRSKLREGQADLVESEWQGLGLDYHIFGQSFGGGAFFVPEGKGGAPGTQPVSERAVNGAIVGKEAFDIFEDPSIYLPGSIAEHITSFGAQIGEKLSFGQTRCTEWIRAGASGTSGTIVEPGATDARFPHSRIHSFYQMGCTLGEAFFLTINNPFLTLVLGDPLTQPYAQIPEVSITGVTEGQSVSGMLSVAVTTGSTPDLEPQLDLVVDGRVVAVGSVLDPVDASRVPGGFEIDTTSLTEGWHEIRVVGYASNAVRSQGFDAVSVRVDNSSAGIFLTGPGTIDYGSDLGVTVSPIGLSSVDRIELRTLGRSVAQLPPAGGSIQIPATVFRRDGSNHLYAVAVLSDGSEISSDPLKIDVFWAPAVAQAAAPVLDGQVAWARVFPDVSSSGFDWSSATPAAVIPVDDRYAIMVEQSDQWPGFEGAAHESGEVAGVEFVTHWFARETGVYDFVLSGQRDMGMTLDGVEIQPVSNGWPLLFSASVERGWHEVRLRARLGTFSNNNIMPFQPMFRGRYTGRFHWQGHAVEEYESFNLQHCAAPAMPPVGPRPPLTAGRATGPGALSLIWNDLFTGESGWRVERFLGDPDVELIEYLGSATAPVLVGADDPDAFGPGAAVAIDDASDRFTFVQPFMQGARLLAARADGADDGQNTLYRVHVPAGTTVYAVVNVSNTMPPWMNAQGGWTQFSRPNQPQEGAQVESEETVLWTVFMKSVDTEQILDLGGAQGSSNLVPDANAITFVFIPNTGSWEAVETIGANATGSNLSGLSNGPGTYRVVAEFGNQLAIPSLPVALDLSGSEPNGTPVAAIGPDQIWPVGSPFPLDGRGKDDGLPTPPGSLSYLWEGLNGPAAVIFSDVSDPQSTATFPTEGNYELRFTVQDGDRMRSHSLTVQAVAIDNEAPTVDAGPDRAISITETLELSPVVSDDGLPWQPGAGLLAEWRVISGPVLPAFLDRHQASTEVVFLQPGTYEFELAVNDGEVTSTDRIMITVSSLPGAANQAPMLTVTSGTPIETATGISVALSAAATDDGLPAPASLSYSWREFSGSENLFVPSSNFSTPNQATTEVSFEQPGTYHLMVSVTDGDLTSFLLIPAVVELNEEGNEAPTVVLGAPSPVVFTELPLVDVTVSDDGLPDPPAALAYTWTKLSGPGDIFVTLIEDGTRAQVAVTEPGDYEIELEVSDGSKSASDTAQILVEDKAKYRVIWGWGRNQDGEIGPFQVGDDMDGPRPVAHAWSDVGANAFVSFGIDPSGRLLASGGDTSSSINRSLIGTNPSMPRFRFEPVEGLPPVQAVAHLRDSVAVLDRDGSVWTWGHYFFGALGYPASQLQLTPKKIEGFQAVKGLFGGNRSALAVKEDGSVWVWGDNAAGKLGLGNSISPITAPTQVTGLSGVRQAVMGTLNTYLLMNDGTVQASGGNNDGQLGAGTVGSDRLTFAPVLTGPGTPLTDIVELAVGINHVLALSGQGRVWAWGNNPQGQLGVGDDDERSLATAVSDPDDSSGYLSGVIDIAATNSASFAVKADGSVLGWGWKFGNVFGNERPAVDRVYPGPVTGLPAVEEIWSGALGLFAAAPYRTYQDFVNERYSPTDVQNGLADPDVVPEGSRFSNLLNYVLDRDPGDHGAPVSYQIESGQFLTKVTYLATLGDAVIEFETSSDLSGWDPAEPDSVDYVLEGDKATETLRFNLATPERLFIRLRVKDYIQVD